MSMLTEAAAFLEKERKAHLSESVIYDRLGVQVTLAATRAGTKFDRVDESGMVVGDVAVDFIFSTADLILSGSETLPQIGDKILLTQGSEILHFEVLDMGLANHYEVVPFRNALRVHTMHVETT